MKRRNFENVTVKKMQVFKNMIIGERIKKFFENKY
jgi:hypothetical protein